MSVFKWAEFVDKEKNDDFFKALKMEPILDKDIKIAEKDLDDDKCEIEMRTNLVCTLLMSIAYAYMKLHFYDEAVKCLDYAIELIPLASDAYLRRSQVVMYNKGSSVEDLKRAVTDANKALERRPKDKFYLAHKEELTRVIQANITNKV